MFATGVLLTAVVRRAMTNLPPLVPSQRSRSLGSSPGDQKTRRPKVYKSISVYISISHRIHVWNISLHLGDIYAYGLETVQVKRCFLPASCFLRHGCGGVGWDDNVRCCWTHAWWFIAVGHMLDATPLWCCLQVCTWSMLRHGCGGVGWDDNVRCFCTHAWCHKQRSDAVGAVW